MELTIEQMLQQGIAAHREGKLDEAERLYRAVLQSQPKHPDANHNLGVLAVSNNKTDSALSLFKTALESNAKIEHFWLSFIDALINAEKLDDAQRAGISAAKLQRWEGKMKSKRSPINDMPRKEYSHQSESHQDELSPR